MPPMEWIWLGAIVVFAVLEASTSAMVSLWFVGGSLAALIATLCGAELWLQCALFLLVSALFLMSLRPLARKYLTPKRVATNARSNIGKEAVVTEQIDNLHGTGALRLGGVEWSARSVDDSVIEAETVVEVVEIQGVKLCVKRAENKGGN